MTQDGGGRDDLDAKCGIAATNRENEAEIEASDPRAA
jgi:hypothetical protein